MKCNDCGNLGWGDDEGELVYGWCRVRQYCPDLGIERDCSSFLKKRPDALSTLQIENERLRAELEQVKREKDAAASDLESVMAYRGDNGDNLDTCQFCKNGQCYVRGGTKQCLPQWRGPKEGKEDA